MPYYLHTYQISQSPCTACFITACDSFGNKWYSENETEHAENDASISINFKASAAVKLLDRFKIPVLGCSTLRRGFRSLGDVDLPIFASFLSETICVLNCTLWGLITIFEFWNYVPLYILNDFQTRLQIFLPSSYYRWISLVVNWNYR